MNDVRPLWNSAWQFDTLFQPFNSLRTKNFSRRNCNWTPKLWNVDSGEVLHTKTHTIDSKRLLKIGYHAWFMLTVFQVFWKILTVDESSIIAETLVSFHPTTPNLVLYWRGCSLLTLINVACGAGCAAQFLLNSVLLLQVLRIPPPCSMMDHFFARKSKNYRRWNCSSITAWSL